ncbi:WXG100 family type VII secretion target [Streptomyces sp. TRM66268-LWL]|uniref:ESAT-6-like protein n=1 Tax=Streptomyces polyasparticus TaxID=2767826 RepID=A0ABR7SB89_9ACTN|nr:WXG100 family type VII secretion target [Streptomyces polyasparticus]MBC9711761.1 WXG100 family type VII secretion target [Streptomyces polyasparticus]
MAFNDPGELLVKYGTLDEMTTGLGNEAKRLDECLAALRRAVVTVAGGWEGTSQEAFAGEMKTWDADAGAIHQALKEIGAIVARAGGDYMAGDKKAASYFTD